MTKEEIAENVKMIRIKELKRKAKEILESLDGMAVGDGMNVLVYALSWLIESNIEKEKHGECVDDITDLLKTLLVCNDDVEYVRKDALVKKVEEYLYKQLNEGNMECGNIEIFIEDLKKYTEGGEE